MTGGWVGARVGARVVGARVGAWVGAWVVVVVVAAAVVGRGVTGTAVVATAVSPPVSLHAWFAGESHCFVPALNVSPAGHSTGKPLPPIHMM